MYNKNDHKVLKNCPKIKIIPSFERGDQVESKCIIKKNEFWLLKIPTKGAKLKI